MKSKTDTFKYLSTSSSWDDRDRSYVHVSLGGNKNIYTDLWMSRQKQLAQLIMLISIYKYQQNT